MEMFALVLFFIGSFFCGYNYKSKEISKKENISTFDSVGFFRSWLNDCGANLFEWYSDELIDCKFGNYDFRYVEFRVTGRKANKEQIVNWLNKYAYLYNYSVNFLVSIEKQEEYDIIRIVYILPEYMHQFESYIERKNKIKTSNMYQQEKKRKMMDSVGKVTFKAAAKKR